MSSKGVLMGAAIVGGLYWAAKQPGGIRGTWDRLRGAARDIQEGADLREAGRHFMEGESRPMPSASDYSPAGGPAL
jgi:hypothetical protein